MSSPLAEVGPWDLVADGYVNTTRQLLFPYSESLIQALGVTDTDCVLDVAAGPGTLSLEVAKQVKQVTALDFSETMVRHCRFRAQELGLKNVEIVQGDGQNLPFENAAFERAFSSFGLMFFPDRVAGMKEMHRVLKPGGKVGITSWQPAEQSPAFSLIFGTLVEADLIQPQDPSPVRGIDDADVFREELIQAGFSEVSVEPCVHDLVVPSAEELWADSVKGNAPVVMLKEQLGEDWQDASDRALAILKEKVTPGQAFPMPAWLGTGKKL